MPLTPNSRVYEQKLERTRKKYESRNAFATERSRKAREESFSSPAPKNTQISANRFAREPITTKDSALDRAVFGAAKFMLPDVNVLSRAVKDPAGTVRGAGEALSYATPQGQAAHLARYLLKGSPNLTGADMGDVEQAIEIASILPYGKAAKGLKYAPDALKMAKQTSLGSKGLRYSFPSSNQNIAFRTFRAGPKGISLKSTPRMAGGSPKASETTQSKRAIETVTGLFDEELDLTKLKEMASRVNSGDYGLVGGRFGGVDEAITRLYGEPALLPQYSSTGAIQGIKRRLESPAIIRFGETLDTSKDVLNGVEKQVTRTLSESAKRTSRAAAKELFGADSKVKEDLVATLLGLKKLGFMEGVSPTGLKDMIEATVHDAPGLARGAGLLQETASKQLGIALQYSSDPQQALVEYLTRLSMSGRLGSAFKNSSLQVDHFGRYGSPSTTGQWAAKEVTKYLPKDLFRGDKLVPGYLRDWLDAGNSLPSEVTTGIGDVVRHQSSEKNVSGISEPVNLNWGALPRELGYLMDPTIIRNIGRDSFGLLKPGSKYLKERVPMHTQFWDDFFERNPLSSGFWEFANNPETLSKADLRRIGRVRGKHN